MLFFRRISNSMEISFHSHFESNRVIATSDGQQRKYSKAKFSLNLNCGQKIVSKTGPERSKWFQQDRAQTFVTEAMQLE